jgi:RNA polymerase sigma-70 factor (ECF subfamily)
MAEIVDQSCFQSADGSGESALVDGFRRGDAASFEQMVALYSKQVHTLASRLLGWPCEIEDVVQDVFVRALIHRKKFRGQSSLKTWLFAITVNVCRSRQYRQALRRRFFFRRKIDGQARPSGYPPDFEPVRKAVSALPARYRQVIVLKYLNECDTREIMEILKISESTLNTRLSRARRILKDSLKTQYGNPCHSREGGNPDFAV